MEILKNGEVKTPFLRHGDKVRLEMLDDSGKSIFGAIEQTGFGGGLTGFTRR